jgi:AcrR family transcriptional regulator
MTQPAESRFDRRKAATRARIAAAGEELLATRGYDNTSMEDIAELADVAIRTIYLHFPSKAAIMLAQFDGWLEAFVDALNARPIEEALAASVRHALAELDAQGWPDRSFGSMADLHPMAEMLASGNAEVAGHVMHQWVLAQDRIAASAAQRSGAKPGDLAPRARAGTVFSIWISTILMVRDRFESGDLEPTRTGNQLGADLIDLAVPPTL